MTCSSAARPLPIASTSSTCSVLRSSSSIRRPSTTSLLTSYFESVASTSLQKKDAYLRPLLKPLLCSWMMWLFKSSSSLSMPTYFSFNYLLSSSSSLILTFIFFSEFKHRTFHEHRHFLSDAHSCHSFSQAAFSYSCLAAWVFSSFWSFSTLALPPSFNSIYKKVPTLRPKINALLLNSNNVLIIALGSMLSMEKITNSGK